MRNYLSITLIGALIATGFATPVEAQPKSKPSAGTVTALTVSAKGEADRALKFRLLPTVYEQQAGNAVVTYMMAASSLPEKAWPDEYDQWLDMPLDELPVKKVEAAIGNASDLGLAHDAARRMRVEWDLTNIRTHGYTAMLPHIQHQRTLARRLALRIRLRIKQERFDDAIEDVKTGMAMGHHMEKGSTLIESLVGIAICSMMVERLEEFIQQPDASNLYWALAALPRPLVDMSEGLQYEQFGIKFMIKQVLVKQADRPLASQLDSVSNQLVDMLSAAGSDFMIGPVEGDEAKIKVRMAAAGMVVYTYPRARRYFIEKKGMTAAEVDKLPVSNVAIGYELEKYTYWRDEMFKWFALPYWQAAEGYRETEERFTSAAKNHQTGVLSSIVLPAIGGAKRAEVRLDRRIAAVQAVESLRMHAAKHSQWPDSLTNLKTPAPLDPFTGKPFVYTVNNDTATLQGLVPKGGRDQDAINYRIKLRK